MSHLPPPPATRRLGTSDIEISPLAWGMWRLAENGRTAAEAAKLVHAALDAGIPLLDTADIYGFDGKGGFGDAEALLGEVLAAEPALRSRMVLASKGGILPPLPARPGKEERGRHYTERALIAMRRFAREHGLRYDPQAAAALEPV